MANVAFARTQTKQSVLYFDNLKKNENFKVVSNRARGAVYRKVLNTMYRPGNGQLQYMQMEEVTGELYAPTSSPVEIVPVDVSIIGDKPHIYS